MKKSTLLFVIMCIVSLCIHTGCGTPPKQTFEPKKVEKFEPEKKVEKKVYPGAVGPIR